MLNGKLFIHIPKNGGMSIRHGQSKFRERMGPQGLIWPRAPIMKKGYHEPFEAKMRQLGRPNVPYEHARWRDLSRDVQFAYDAFAIVRNPWSRVVSRYTFAVRNNNDWDSVTINGKKTGGRNMTFDEFLDQRHQWIDNVGGCGDATFSWHLAIRGWWNAFDYVCDDKGHLRCKMMRFENYEQDVNQFFGYPKNEPIFIRNVSQGDKAEDGLSIAGRKDYREYYNSEQMQIVADWYKKDIDFFGFDFDTAATKNIWPKI